MKIHLEIIYVFFFIAILTTFRLLPHPPNFTPILAAAIVGPFFFKSKPLSIFVVLLSMLISDIFLGFHIYQIVIYFTLLSISLVSSTIIKKTYLIIVSFLASLWFFIVTNLAVWFFWDYYPKTIEGLILCYTLAIPFFTNTLFSTIFFTVLSIFFLKPVDKIYKNYQNIYKKII